MALVTGHGGRDHRLLGAAVDLDELGADEEQLGLHPQRALDVAARVVPRAGEAALLPQGDDGLGVGGVEGADLHAPT